MNNEYALMLPERNKPFVICRQNLKAALYIYIIVAFMDDSDDRNNRSNQYVFTSTNSELITMFSKHSASLLDKESHDEFPLVHFDHFQFMHRTYRFLFLFFWNSFLSPSHPLTYASPAYGLSMGSMPGPSQYHASNMHSDQMPMGFMAADNMENMRKMFKVCEVCGEINHVNSNSCIRTGCPRNRIKR
ncbi:unnamed protein product [Rotaria magnacalcarata]|uniref:Uncharacterized protein n=1 Tax=Rotaria magnacalcarata TaxID=392030 RepID=A0A8S2QKW6_9BILA|nr:unnamed protein product [Rotaria magnacalcarata]